VGVYLYCIDDLDEVCQRNKDARSQQWPHANEIIDEESGLFMAELAHRSTGPWIQRLQDQAQQLKSDELERLLNKLGENANEAVREELDIAFDRLINKLLHPPLESLRNGAHDADHRGLVEALKKLFRLKE
jgi:glutamyl-tRNA reductase